MNRTIHTTRKGFFKGAGLALAGIFALNRAPGPMTSSRSGGSTVQADLTVMSRVRTVGGAVEFDTVR